jgi:hypothetical protein
MGVNTIHHFVRPITVGVRMRESNVGGGEGEGVVRVMRKMFRGGSKAKPRLRLPGFAATTNA